MRTYALTQPVSQSVSQSVSKSNSQIEVDTTSFTAHLET